MRFWLAVGLIGAMLLGGMGCRSSNRAEVVEREIASRAPDYIGSAEHYRAEVRGIGRDQVEEVRLYGFNVKPEPDLVIDPLVVTLRGVTFETAPFRVAQVATARFSGRVSQGALNYYLRMRGPTPSSAVGSIYVRFEKGVMRVDATVRILAVDVPVSTTGTVRLNAGPHINYEPRKLTAIGNINIPAGVRELLANQVNPLLDLSGLRFTPRVTEVTIEPGGLTFSGTAQLRELP